MWSYFSKSQIRSEENKVSTNQTVTTRDPLPSPSTNKLSEPFTKIQEEKKQQKACIVKLFEGGKVRITVNSSTLTMDDVHDAMQTYSKILHNAENNSLIVYYNIEQIDVLKIWPMFMNIVHMFVDSRPLLEQKLAMYAANIPYPNLIKAIQPIIEKYPSEIPRFIGSNDIECREFLKQTQLKWKKTK